MSFFVIVWECLASVIFSLWKYSWNAVTRKVLHMLIISILIFVGEKFLNNLILISLYFQMICQLDFSLYIMMVWIVQVATAGREKKGQKEDYPGKLFMVFRSIGRESSHSTWNFNFLSCCLPLINFGSHWHVHKSVL